MIALSIVILEESKAVELVLKRKILEPTWQIEQKLEDLNTEFSELKTQKIPAIEGKIVPQATGTSTLWWFWTN